MSRETHYRRYDVVVGFARHGVAIDVIARALGAPTEHVVKICDNAIEGEDLQCMPPATSLDTRHVMHAEIANLRGELDRAKAMIQDLSGKREKRLNTFNGVVGLTHNEARVVAELVTSTGNRASKQAIYTAIYAHLPEGDQPEPKIIDIFICKIRKKIGPKGIKIRTVRGEGYMLDAENANKLRALAGLPHVESPSLVPVQ